MTGRKTAARFLFYLCTVKKSSNIIITCITLLVVTLFVASFAGGSFMVKYALLHEVNYDEKAEIAKLSDRSHGLTEWTEDLISEGVFRDTSIMIDGLEKHAYLIKNADPSAKTAIVIHGYTSNPMHMMPIARMFRDSLGYNVLLPHLHYHGFSEGAAIQMGWLDRLDVMKWMEVAHEAFNDTLQVVHGISMGGATTMMVSGEQLPEYVRGFIEDCGYTSAWDQFKKELYEDFHLPAFPVLYSADIITYLRYGWHFKEASSMDQVSKCPKPMMFIHGDSDDFVPTWMGPANYDAKTQGYKEIWLAEGAAHGESFRKHEDEYVARVRKFLAEHVE